MSVGSADRNGQLDFDTLFDVLRSERRRATLRVLNSAERGLHKGDLVDRVALRVGGSGEVTKEERRAVQISLHQNHLPKLIDVEAVEQRTGSRYYPGPAAKQCLDSLALFEEADR